MNQYIVTGNKPNTNESSCLTIGAASARDAYLAFTKHGYIDNVTIIPIVEAPKETD